MRERDRVTGEARTCRCDETWLASRVARRAQCTRAAWRAVAIGGIGERSAAVRCQLVVPPLWPRLVLCDLAVLPLRGDHAFALEPAEYRIDRSARQIRRVHDVEPVVIAV